MLKKVLFPLLLTFTIASATAQVNDLERATPESQGIKSATLVSLFDQLTTLKNVDIHSVMVLRHGKVVGEIYPTPFDAKYKHTMYSCSKTFVSAAIGLAIEENRLRLDDRIAPLFAADLPAEISKELASITVRDLLTMQAGIEPDWNMRNNRRDWVRGYLSKPVSTPGKSFKYDSLCTYMLSAIIQKVTGKTLLEYLRPRLFEPMNIWDVEWEVSPEGYNTGGWGLHIQSESLAKFGQLLLNGGEWAGRQVLPQHWVKAMMTRQVEAGNEDYGYQIWMCDYPGAWRADGAYGQYVIVVPSKDMVIVVTQCSMMDGMKERQIIWRTLLDHVADTATDDPKAYSNLLKKQKAYTFPTVQGKSTSWKASALEGRKIALANNPFGWKTIKFNFADKALTAEITDFVGKITVLKAGYNSWTTTQIGSNPPYSIAAIGRMHGLKAPFHAAASYAGDKAGTSLAMRIHYVDWISALGVTLRFTDMNNVSLEIRPNYENRTHTIKGTIE